MNISFKHFKKPAVLFSILSCCFFLTACNSPKQSGTGTAEKGTGITLKIGAAVMPHAEILNFIKPMLKTQGVNLEIVVIDEEGWMNPALAEKQLDANYFQHVPYLNSVAREKKYDFAVAAKVHVEPIGFYSRKIKSLSELSNGATIAIPNNPSNEFRSLVLLERNGLIKLKKNIKDFESTPRDIAENPKNLKFIEVESAQLTRSLGDVDAALINTNYVLEAKIDPATAIFREDANSPYVNIIVVRKADENRPEIKILAKTVTSQEVRNFIKDKYGVAVIPAF